MYFATIRITHNIVPYVYFKSITDYVRTYTSIIGVHNTYAYCCDVLYDT